MVLEVRISLYGMSTIPVSKEKFYANRWYVVCIGLLDGNDRKPQKTDMVIIVFVNFVIENEHMAYLT